MRRPARELPLLDRAGILLSAAPFYPSLIRNSESVTRLFRRDTSSASHRRHCLKSREHITVSTVKALQADYKWCKESLEAVTPELSGEPTFDIVFSTYGPMGSLWLGKQLMKERKGQAWVVDLRDPIQCPEAPFVVRDFIRRQRDGFIKDADLVTTVSEGILDDLMSNRKLRRLRENAPSSRTASLAEN